MLFIHRAQHTFQSTQINLPDPKQAPKDPSHQFICQLPAARTRTANTHRQKKKSEGSPDDASQYCNGEVIAPPGCKQSPGDKGGKN
ncbi:hypothetical protein DENSPDRAFT_837614 [Dentipellis sp. KUC8613]|nr:hypothetical protein DENSPDRAFT_837614 [Dentipellis sp. KUC8613]